MWSSTHTFDIIQNEKPDSSLMWEVSLVVRNAQCSSGLSLQCYSLQLKCKSSFSQAPWTLFSAAAETHLVMITLLWKGILRNPEGPKCRTKQSGRVQPKKWAPFTAGDDYKIVSAANKMWHKEKKNTKFKNGSNSTEMPKHQLKKNLSILNACFWTVRGDRSTQRKLRQGEKTNCTKIAWT